MPTTKTTTSPNAAGNLYSITYTDPMGNVCGVYTGNRRLTYKTLAGAEKFARRDMLGVLGRSLCAVRVWVGTIDYPRAFEVK